MSLWWISVNQLDRSSSWIGFINYFVRRDGIEMVILKEQEFKFTSMGELVVSVEDAAAAHFRYTLRFLGTFTFWPWGWIRLFEVSAIIP